MNWLWFIPILLIMVVLHELGHFLTARYFGMKVHEFGIGFPPKIWSKKTKDGMEWSINALPIGGFVRIEGESGDSDDPNAFGKKPTWQRAIVLIAGPAMNILLAFTLYFLISAFGGEQVADGRPAIIEVNPNSPAALAGLQPGDVFVTINDKPVKSVSDISLETALDKNNPVRLVMQRGSSQFTASVMPRKNPPEGEGALGVGLGNSYNDLMIANTADLNKQLGLTGADALKDRDKIISLDGQQFADNVTMQQYLLNTNKDSLSLVISRDGQPVTINVPVQAVVNTVYKDSSAASQNLPGGAIVTRLDSTPIHNRFQYEQYLNANPNKQIMLYYKKSFSDPEQSLILLNSSLDAKADNRAPTVRNYVFSYIVPTHHITYNPIQATGQAWDQTTFAITLIPRTFKGLFDGSVSVKNLAGPIGMAQITDTVVTRSAADGIWSLLRTLATLMALLSVNLGIVNILPLPALDGGRLVFVLFEMITRGKRVPPEKESLVHLAGMVALLGLMVLIAWQDIARLLTGGSFQ